MFVLAAAEAPPCELSGLADLVTVTFPWGSLLRGVLGLDEAVVEGLATLVAPGGCLRALFSVEGRDRAGVDGLGGDADMEARMRNAFAAAGVDLIELRPASHREVDASNSSWARRLRVGRDRTAWMAVFRRDSEPPTIG